MRIQGIKASIAWNALRVGDADVIDLDARNHIEVAKVVLNKDTVEILRDDYPEIYNKALDLLESPEFKKDGKVSAIAIPTTEDVPEWLTRIVNTNEIVSDNLKGFPLESVCISRFGKGVPVSNILQL
jgi:hypothetical protein